MRSESSSSSLKAPRFANRIANPTVLIIRLDELSDEEAHAFFETFVERMPGRLSQFKREVAAEGGPAEAELNETPASPVPLWRWFVETSDAIEARRRPPPAWDTLPPWSEPDHPGLLPPSPRWVTWFADGLAYYWAACFQRSHPEMHWELGAFPKRLRVVEQNHPLLRGHGIQMSPLQIATVSVRSVVRYGVDREADSLRNAYERWAGHAGAERWPAG